MINLGRALKLHCNGFTPKVPGGLQSHGSSNLFFAHILSNSSIALDTVTSFMKVCSLLVFIILHWAGWSASLWTPYSVFFSPSSDICLNVLSFAQLPHFHWALTPNDFLTCSPAATKSPEALKSSFLTRSSTSTNKSR